MMEENQNPAVDETKTAPSYGEEIQRFGKWIVTGNGVLFERQEIGQADYFLESGSCGDRTFMKEALKMLLEATWLTEPDYHDFVRAWFYTLSLIKENPQKEQPILSELLSDVQAALEKKFSAHLINENP